MQTSGLEHLHRSESPWGGFRRISRSLVRDLETHAPERSREERIHESRVATKKLRAYLSLLRPAIGDSAFHEIQRPLREASHSLSVHRDRDVAVATLKLLGKRAGKQQRKSLLNSARTIEKLSRTPKWLKNQQLALEHLNRTLESAVDEFEAVKIRQRGWQVLGPGYALTYARCRQQLRRWRASGRSEDSHKLRRCTKYLGFQVALLESANPDEISRLFAELKDLGHSLGRLHDCTNLVSLVREKKLKDRIPSADRKQIRLAAHALEEELARECLPLAERLFAPAPAEFADRLERDWRRWRASR